MSDERLREALEGLREEARLDLDQLDELADQFADVRVTSNTLRSRQVKKCVANLRRVLNVLGSSTAYSSPRSPVSTSSGPSQSSASAPDMRSVLTSGVELVESAFAHVSHGGPTRADAEEWITEARNVLRT